MRGGDIVWGIQIQSLPASNAIQSGKFVQELQVLILFGDPLFYRGRDWVVKSLIGI